jgi:FAD/FMN-containing dehydrogenase/Fe-S oxidoreductase
VDQSQRIVDDLKGLFKGELLFDDLSRALYSTDASIFQIQPLGVVVPRDEDDVRSIVRYAAEHQLTLVPRGAGTGLAGESLGPGLIVDLSRHFRSIVEVGADTVRVQPGVVYQELDRALARVGRRFAPDPTSGVQCTIGGMLATNASGAKALLHGYTRDHVADIRLVLDNGEAVTAGQVARADISTLAPARWQTILRHVDGLLVKHKDLIAAGRPRTRFDRCGYLLQDVLVSGQLNLARLLVGSEGTLGFFAEATLKTISLPGGRSLVVLGLDSLDAALRASQQALPFSPAACELIDRRLVSLTRGSGADAKSLIPAGAEAVVLVEFESDSQNEAVEMARSLVDRLQSAPGLGNLYAQIASLAEEVDRIWTLREAVLPVLYGLRGGRQPVAFVEDVGVPPEELGAFLHRAQEILQRHETTASFLIHAGSGQVHTRPFLDLENPADLAKLWAIAVDIHTLTIGMGGTISSQHGTGLARTPWVSEQYGPLYPVMRELKAIFDPHLVFNPGKIIGPSPGMPAWPVRRLPPEKADFSPRFLHWHDGEIRAESVHCNGCGHCRIDAPERRMCPVFRATHQEAATPRAKANLLRHLLQDGVDGHRIASDEVREVADLCVNCRMCAVECPAHVNIPKLMLEAKAANVAEHGLDRTDWTLASTEGFAAFASMFAPIVNAALASRTVRWFVEKLFGVSRLRHLPTFTSRSFLRKAKKCGWTRPPRGKGPRVAYFVDIYPNYNDPQIAEATVAVLHHNGMEVYVPPDQTGCGMAPLAYGDIETARETARHNLRVFAELAREGYRIVCSEPTAALMLRHDYPELCDDPEARTVADRVVELTALLGELNAAGRLRTDFRRLELSIGHHVPCHLKALGQPPAGPALLSLIPGMQVHTIDVNCSGMAGTFGLKARNYELSLEAGRPMLDRLRRPEVSFGSTECSTCRLQMEEGTRKRTLHPAQYLALAYGLMPEVSERLRRPIRDLVLQ